jgi:hypothetical protein
MRGARKGSTLPALFKPSKIEFQCPHGAHFDPVPQGLAWCSARKSAAFPALAGLRLCGKTCGTGLGILCSIHLS